MKYQTGKKSALSLFLVLSMGMTLLPTTAMAEDSIEESGVEATEQDGADENDAVAAFTADEDDTVAVLAADENTPTSGSCSDGYYGDLEWNYNKSTKTLTISGYGIMSDNYGSIGWTPFCDEIENIVVKEGTTWIGSNAFKDMPNLTSVQLGKGVKEIHEGAFANDTALESIDIPDSVTYIAYDVFKDCGKLKKVGMSASLKYLCNSFSGTAIEVLEVPSSVTEVRTNALENISGLKVIYAGSEAVAELCKEEMPNLTYCITDDGKLKMNQTFTATNFCAVEREGDIFDGWYIEDKKATSLATGKTYTAKWTADPTAVVEGDCSDTDEDNVTWKYERATKTLTISGTGDMDNYTASWSVGPYVPYEKFKGEIEKIVVEDGVESIGNGAFSEMPKLKDVDLGKVKEIGTYVFYGQNEEGSIDDISLESLVIPDTVTVIERCFAHGAINLKNVQMSRNLKYLYAYAFSETSVEVLELPESVARIKEWGDYGQHAFDGDYSKLKMIYAGSADVMELCKERLRNNVTYAVTNGGYLVKGQDLTSTAFGEVEKDGYVLEGWYDNAAFSGEPVTAPTAKGVYYAKWATDTSASGECGDNATWSYKKSTKTLTISGSGAMANYADTDSVPWKDLNIENLVISDAITSIGANAFNGTNISNIVIPNVTSVGENAFANLPEKSVIYVNNDALFNAIDSSITKERTAVCHLDGAVLTDTELTAGVFGTPVKEGLAFAGWRKILSNGNLNDYSPTKEPVAGEKYKALFSEKSGKCGANATWTYDDVSGTLTISGTGRMYDYTSILADNANPRPWNAVASFIKKGVIEDGITYVGSYAFANMTMELKEVTLGKDITEIGDKAFYCTRKVANYTLPEGLTKIGEFAFSGTDSLKGIKIPDSVTEIGADAFNRSGMHGIVIPKSVTTVGKGAFVYLDLLSEEGGQVPVVYVDNKELAARKDLSLEGNSTASLAICDLNGGKMNKTVFEANKLAVPTRAGYIFQGWYEADENGQATETKADVPAANKVYIAKWVESDVTAAAENYSGAYDGEEHSITVSYPEDAGVTAVRYSTDGETYSATNPAFKDVTNGAQTVYYRVMREEVAVAEGSATVEITPCDNPVTMTASPASLKNGGTVTLTIKVNAKAAESNLVIGNVTCDKSEIEVIAGEGGTYTVVIPASPSATYTFTAEVSGDWITNSKTPEVKAVVVNTYGTTSSSGGHSSHRKNNTTNTTDKNTEETPADKPAETKTIKMQIGNKVVTVGENTITNDTAPLIRNDRTMVPIRIITETLGGKVDWNEAAKEVTLTIDGKEIKMTIGKVLEKYGVAPVIINDRTFVPVRFVADELGATVAWDDATKTVTMIK